jgi:hypothetical protein
VQYLKNCQTATLQEWVPLQYDTSADNKHTSCPCVGLFTEVCLASYNHQKLLKIDAIPHHATARCLVTGFLHWRPARHASLCEICGEKVALEHVFL